MSIEHLIRGVLGDKAPNRDRPLWQCKPCGITLGEWNPALAERQLYCPACRQPMTRQGAKQLAPPPAGTVTIDVKPEIEQPKKTRRQLPAPPPREQK